MTSLVFAIVLLLTPAAGQRKHVEPSSFSLTGAQSGIHKAETMVIRDAGDWTKLWRRHARGEKAPSVNFGQNMVVVVYAGMRRTGGYSVKFTGMKEQNGAIVISAVVEAPPKDAIVTQAITYPFAMQSYPRTTKMVTVEVTDKKP